MVKDAGAPAAQLPLGEYGLLADGHTAALIGADGGIGFLCLPRFDSPTVFAPLLDAGRGGHCRLAPSGVTNGGQRGRQRYLRRTNVLVTDFGDAVVTDWMPPRYERDGGCGALCRRVQARRASYVEFDCAPRFDYGSRTARWRRVGRGWRAAGLEDGGGLWLSGSGGVHPRMRFRLPAGGSAWFVLSWGEVENDSAWNEARVLASLQETTAFWRQWAAQAQYMGRHQEAVIRSALALKALVYAPTGAIVAAPTTSLPESIGGERNWDYRYCWPRDATFALYGLSLLGYHEEAGRFLEFITRLPEAQPLPLQVCYRVDGSADLAERELGWLSGNRGSRPVRIGNGAAGQSQLDIYGEILDAAYTYCKWRHGVEPRMWGRLRRLADYAAAHWREPDESIWEVRGGPRQFTYSKVMCWVALDRALKLARRYRMPGPLQRWAREAERIRKAVRRRGYNRRLHTFTQTLDGGTLDASLLLLPLLRFLKPGDPRMRSTLRRVRERLSSNSLVSRYENPDADGVGGSEGAFAICTFWMVDCLTLIGESREARRLFERMTQHASRLGLFSEELDPRTYGLLGNYPQAFTHMALLNSAHNLQLYPEGVPVTRAPSRRSRTARG